MCDPGSTDIVVKKKKEAPAKMSKITAFQFTSELFANRDGVIIPTAQINKAKAVAMKESKPIIYSLFRYAHGAFVPDVIQLSSLTDHSQHLSQAAD